MWSHVVLLLMRSVVPHLYLSSAFNQWNPIPLQCNPAHRLTPHSYPTTICLSLFACLGLPASTASSTLLSALFSNTHNILVPIAAAPGPLGLPSLPLWCNVGTQLFHNSICLHGHPVKATAPSLPHPLLGYSLRNSRMAAAKL
jgi:hypothetical protein